MTFYCSNGKEHVIELTSPDTNVIIQSHGTDLLTSVDITAVSVTGVTVTGSVPYTPYLIINVSGPGYQSQELKITNSNSPNIYSGISIPLESDNTYQFYNPPKRFLKRVGNQFGGGINGSLNIKILDNNGNLASFNNVILYCTENYSNEPEYQSLEETSRKRRRITDYV